MATISPLDQASVVAFEPGARPSNAVAGFASLLAPLTAGSSSAPTPNLDAASPLENERLSQKPSRPGTTSSLRGTRTTSKRENEGEQKLIKLSFSLDSANTLLSPATALSARSTPSVATPASTNTLVGADKDASRTQMVDTSRKTILPQGGGPVDAQDVAGKSLSNTTSLSEATSVSPLDTSAETEDLTVQTTNEWSATSPKAARARKGSTADDLPFESVKSIPGQVDALLDGIGLQKSNQLAASNITQPISASGPSDRLVETASVRVDASSSTGGASSLTPQQPVAQLSHALAAVRTAPDGSSQLRIVLNPAELGSLQVHITRTHDGVSNVIVAVERPETLRSLQTDISHLHQALDRAGFSEQRSVVLHLAASDTGSGLPADTQSGFGGHGAQGNSQQDTHLGQSQTTRNGKVLSGTHHIAADSTQTQRQAVFWRRAGVNITA